MRLTKSNFLTFLDSPMHLWAEVNDKLDSKKFSPYDQLIAKQGYEVERFAKQFLQNKVDTEYPPGSTIDFQYVLTDGSYEARIDALVHDTFNNTYDLYEIKSSTKIDRQNKYDATFQHLIGKATLPIHKTYLVHVNGDYVKNGQIDLQKFFLVEDMTSVINKLEDEVFKLRAKALEILKAEHPPENHCYKPNACTCLQLCHPNIGEYPIYDLSWWKVGQYEKLVEKGYSNLVDIDETEDLNPKQILQLRSIKTQQAIIDHDGISRELGNITFPLYFLDYETFGPAIPIHDGYTPYQHIVFQFSLHILANPEDTQLTHHEFITTESDEPSLQFVEELLKVIGDSGSVIVWNKHFECKRNDELSVLQPIYSDEMESINGRVFDLMDIFKNGLYVDYRFHGSASIKKVLPVLCPDLNYDGMEIAEGATAMTRWWEVVHGNASEEQKGLVRESLLKYCELDTLAMVEIWRKLRQLGHSEVS